MMIKRFNVTGVCVPEKHYMVDLSDKTDRIVSDYVEQGAYFTINRARQYGKTTLLSALARRLEAQYLVLRISFEAADEYFVSPLIFVNGFVMDVTEVLQRKDVDQNMAARWSEKIEGDYPLKTLGRKITELCKTAGKGIVLMIDEVDHCSDNQIFLNFLGLLRNKYLDMQEGNHEELKQTLTEILLDGKRMIYAKSDPVINLGIMFGILSEKEKIVCISNIIFETYLYNHMIVGKLRDKASFGYENSQFVENGVLDMERVLQKFQEIMKAATFMERQGRLLFLCFMKPIINGKGNYYVEPETRNNTRMDVVISYGSREYIVELKIWRGEQYRQSGLEQLERYLDNRNNQKGYLISFDFRQNKTYVQNTIYLKGSQKEIYEITV